MKKPPWPHSCHFCGKCKKCQQAKKEIIKEVMRPSPFLEMIRKKTAHGRPS